MAMSGRTGRLWLAAAAAGLSVIMAQPAVQAWTVRGDAAAWAEVVAALKKQHSVSYRGKSSVFGNPLIVEFAPPDSQHTIIQGKVPEVIAPERITVGNMSWKRDHNGKWDCSDPLTLSPAQLSPHHQHKALRCGPNRPAHPANRGGGNFEDAVEVRLLRLRGADYDRATVQVSLNPRTTYL